VEEDDSKRAVRKAILFFCLFIHFILLLGDMLWLDDWKKTAQSELAVKRFCFFAHLLSVSLSPQMPFS